MSDSIKDTKKDVQDKKALDLAIFNKLSGLFLNKHHSFLSRKLERLTSALYVVTGFLPQDEPVRKRLRTCALELITYAARPASFTGEGLDAFRAHAEEIGVLLQMARSTGLVSQMNAQLLSEEYAALVEFVKRHSADLNLNDDVKSDVSLKTSEGEDESVKSFDNGVSDFVPKLSKGHSKSVTKKGHQDRRKAIFDLLNKKDRISIKDAAKAIDWCSEKTVQRELLDLVEEGLVIKEGERRWSTYRKAPPQAPQQA